ncbi:hypothetical protein [Rhodoplanes sp. Z2-YC6860]|uniref:hypothetical protein n=1 Tax=Rhodoplanes sp. Z2-YC6860 TaxID=674703 RepID=UPI00078E3C46|nr:hypothetical protein [Rhodoplanes sp. Z2-YC6860]AMN43626.1 hypothetical protein RHPLAN_52030 [Rhodoplanes sp. Z2-YC6860]
MADPKPQDRKNSNSGQPTAPVPEDYYALLKKLIADVTADHAMLRKLVYALAWQNLNPETIVSKPVSEAKNQAKTIVELEKAVLLERAIQQLEIEADNTAQHGQPPITGAVPRDAAPGKGVGQPDNKPIPTVADDPSFDIELQKSEQPADGPMDLDALISNSNSGAEHSKSEVERDPQLEALDASFEPPRARGSVMLLPEPAPGSQQTEIVKLERIPSWLDPKVRIALDAIEYEPVRHPPPPHQPRSNFVSFLQLIAASVIGVVLYIGITGWVYIGRQTGFAPPTPAPQAPVAAPPRAEAVPIDSPAVPVKPREPEPILPFPLPRSFGVFAGVPGKLFELEQLPIKAPDPRILVSAEITKPSSVTIPGDNLAFVVFRRDLVTSAPQTASVRVVAQVRSTTKYVDGKPTVVPLKGTWRIRSKEYVFKVSPLEGHNEMIVIQPDPGFVFQPGRYALILNGFGYDFTVAGQITAPEQCLEQVEVVNGAVVTECPKT